MPPFTIRPLETDDIPDVVRMIHELTAFHNDTGTASIETVTRDTTGPNPWWHVFVAVLDGQMIGYMVLLPLSKVADGTRGIDINHLYLRDGHRGAGVGRAFIETAAQFAAANACSYLHIATAAENTAAQNAYLACGFEARPDPDGPRFRMAI